MKRNKTKNLKYYKSLNYPITVERFEDNGDLRFGLQIPDLPGVWADGKTIEEAYGSLDESKELWLKVRLEKGLDIPEPVSEVDFSGKFILRLYPKLHMLLSKGAKRAKKSLNQHITSLLENQIRNSDLMSEIKRVGKTLTKHSKTMETRATGMKSLEHRMDSLEEAYSSSYGLVRATVAAWVADHEDIIPIEVSAEFSSTGLSSSWKTEH